MLCAACGSTLPPEARFCSSCGAKVAAPESRAILTPAEQPAPRHERRLLTVMFGDLVGFTSASDGADPEDVRARVRPFQDRHPRPDRRREGSAGRGRRDGRHGCGSGRHMPPGRRAVPPRRDLDPPAPILDGTQWGRCPGTMGGRPGRAFNLRASERPTGRVDRFRAPFGADRPAIPGLMIGSWNARRACASRRACSHTPRR
jgi:hypothetical protein